MTAYNTTEFIIQIPRRAGWHDVHARVTWTPLDGQRQTIEGAFQDANDPNGPIFLACGIESIAEALGLTYALDDNEHTIALCELVTVQLERRPYAELVCPQGHLLLDLVPR